jgi:hypothetical protein
LSGLELGARWLAASLLATHSTTRPKAIALLRQIIEATDSPAARRALAARSLEQGDPSGLASLLEGHEADSADLTAADRTSLAALTGAPSTLVDRWLGRIETDPRLTPLTAAAASATRPPDAPLGPACGSEAKRAGLALGRALVASQADGAEPGLLRSTLEAYAVAREDDPLVSVLEGELALSAGAAGRVAHSIAATAGAEGPSGERDKHLAAGLLLEIGRDADSAARQWASALGADPGAEPPARALMAEATPSGAADLLIGLADAVSDEPRKALLLVEAALRVGMASEDFPALLDRAIESAPGFAVCAPPWKAAGTTARRRRGPARAAASAPSRGGRSDRECPRRHPRGAAHRRHRARNGGRAPRDGLGGSADGRRAARAGRAFVARGRQLARRLARGRGRQCRGPNARASAARGRPGIRASGRSRGRRPGSQTPLPARTAATSRVSRRSDWPLTARAAPRWPSG